MGTPAADIGVLPSVPEEDDAFAMSAFDRRVRSPQWRPMGAAITMRTDMPRYIVKRTFPDGLRLPTDAEGAKVAASVVRRNAQQGVTWIHSYVTEDRGTTFCIYDGPDPKAVRDVAGANGLPCDTVTPVNVLDPYFY